MMRLWKHVCMGGYKAFRESGPLTKTLGAPEHVQDQGWGCLPSQGVF